MKELLSRLGGWGKVPLRRFGPAALVVLAGLALLLWPTGQKGETGGETASASSAFDLGALEEEMETALSQIRGVGDVTVVLTLKNNGEQVLASDRTEKSDEWSEEVVTVNQGTGRTGAVTVREDWPDFQGALVVCTGGGDPTVRLAVTESVAALTGLSTHQIAVKEGK